ncbi:MAG: PASTA domain-containing protein, partial [Tissierellia bacterium]|nr:PASTA domain-containing protein [Tissierellia bacterium]
LINAVNAMANGGYLMKPRIVSQLIDNEGNIIMENETEIIRQVISKTTSDTMMEMMESVVTNGTGTNAYVPGYKVAGKTGTAQKIIDGKYAPGKYIGSFLAVAPATDPKVSVLVIVDEPVGVYYGGSVAAPVAGKLIEEILDYMEIEPEFTEEEKEQFEYMVKVPDVRGKTIGEAGRILLESQLKYTSESFNIKEDSKIIDQFPSPDMEVSKGSIVDLYLDEEFKLENKVILPNLIGRSKEDVMKILEGLGLKYYFIGEGTVIKQVPEPNSQVDKNSTIEVEFSKTKE